MTEIAGTCKHGYTVSLRANGKPRCPYCRYELHRAAPPPEGVPLQDLLEAEPTPPPKPKRKRKKE
jgi:hypothetical protein